ncbi:MAG: hypothetical protein NVSMB8_00020 [Candidatus Limnocylindrales bacterium]
MKTAAVVPVARWVMRGLLLVVLSFANLQLIWSPDVLPNTLFAWTVVRSGDLTYDEFTGTGTGAAAGPDRIDREAYFFRACGASTATAPPAAPRSAGGPPAPGPNDHVCSIFPPGMAILALPLLAPAVLLGVSPGDATALLYLGHLAAAIVEALATLLLWSVLGRFVTAQWALTLTLLYAFATSVRTVASQALWQHAGVHLFIALSLWLVLHERPVALRRELAAGLALGLGGVVRQTTALLAVGLGGGRRIIAVLAAAAVGLLPLLVYDQLAFGQPFEQGYGSKPFDTPLPVGLYGLLLSPSRGLLIYAPYLGFALLSLVLAWRRPGLVARRLRGLGVVWVLTLALYATYTEWWGGRVFGPRFLDDQAPVLFAALAWGIGHGLLARRGARAVFGATAAWSVLLFNAAALVYDQRWDTVPVNVNFRPERLFDWADPQWLAVLASLPGSGPRAVAALVLSLAALALLLRVEGVIVRRPLSSAG